jgi:hypothetical protein
MMGFNLFQQTRMLSTATHTHRLDYTSTEPFYSNQQPERSFPVTVVMITLILSIAEKRIKSISICLFKSLKKNIFNVL